MPDEPIQIAIRQIEPGDNVAGLSIGDGQYASLKMFFRKSAKTYHQSDLAKTYVAVTSEAKIVGYVTLVCGEIEAAVNNGVPGEGITYSYDHYPAIKIARLLVDARARGWGIGQALVDFALGTTKVVVCPTVGCRFMVVDAKAPAVGFYEQCGFTLLDTPTNRDRSAPIMFVDLHRLPTDGAVAGPSRN